MESNCSVFFLSRDHAAGVMSKEDVVKHWRYKGGERGVENVVENVVGVRESEMDYEKEEVDAK